MDNRKMNNQDLAAKSQQISERVNPAVTNGLSLASGGGVAFQNMTEAMEAAKLMAISDHAVRPHLRGNPGACLGIIIQAIEWGLSPYAVASKCYVVNDQFAFESQLVQAVILRRAPIRGRIRFAYTGEGQNRKCVATATTLDGDEVEYETPALKDIRPQNSPLWKTDPDQQFSYYAGRGLCRRHFPDVLLGIYDVDEMRGAEGLRDVTPKQRDQDHNPLADAVSALSSEDLQPEDPPSFEVANETPEPPSPPRSGVSTHSDAYRAGAQAFVDGEARQAPEEFSPDECRDFLAGYDAAQDDFEDLEAAQ